MSCCYDFHGWSCLVCFDMEMLASVYCEPTGACRILMPHGGMSTVTALQRS